MNHVVHNIPSPNELHRSKNLQQLVKYVKQKYNFVLNIKSLDWFKYFFKL